MWKAILIIILIALAALIISGYYLGYGKQMQGSTTSIYYPTNQVQNMSLLVISASQLNNSYVYSYSLIPHTTFAGSIDGFNLSILISPQYLASASHTSLGALYEYAYLYENTSIAASALDMLNTKIIQAPHEISGVNPTTYNLSGLGSTATLYKIYPFRIANYSAFALIFAKNATVIELQEICFNSNYNTTCGSSSIYKYAQYVSQKMR